jgi:DNA-binding FrmR family transcriptional regulator
VGRRSEVDTWRGYNSVYVTNKDELLKRLARIEGQVRGIARMVEDDRYCIDVLTQISAVRKAVDAVALELVDDHVRHCIVESSGDERAARTDELMAAVGRLVKT